MTVHYVGCFYLILRPKEDFLPWQYIEHKENLNKRMLATCIKTTVLHDLISPLRESIRVPGSSICSFHCRVVFVVVKLGLKKALNSLHFLLWNVIVKLKYLPLHSVTMMNPSPSALKGLVLPLIYFGVSSNAQPREQRFQCSCPSQLLKKHAAQIDNWHFCKYNIFNI